METSPEVSHRARRKPCRVHPLLAAARRRPARHRGEPRRGPAPASDARPRPAEAPRAEPTRRLTPLILVVEDHDDTREMYEDYLRFVGFDAVAAREGHIAVEMATALKPNVIVLDLMMPKVDGWEVLRRLKTDDRTARIPVIIVTGHELKSYLQYAALAAGADRFLTKPCLPDRLAGEVRRLLQQRSPRAS